MNFHGNACLWLLGKQHTNFQNCPELKAAWGRWTETALVCSRVPTEFPEIQ